MSLIPFQWSIKLDDGQIYMVQADTAENLGLAIQEVKTKFLNSRTIPEPVRTQTTDFVPSPATQATNSQPTEICPVCGSPLIIETTKTGKRVQKCSTNKWDRVRKEVVGCKFVKWL